MTQTLSERCTLSRNEGRIIGQSCARLFAQARVQLVLSTHRNKRLALFSEHMPMRQNHQAHRLGVVLQKNKTLGIIIQGYAENWKATRKANQSFTYGFSVDPIGTVGQLAKYESTPVKANNCDGKFWGDVDDVNSLGRDIMSISLADSDTSIVLTASCSSDLNISESVERQTSDRALVHQIRTRKG